VLLNALSILCISEPLASLITTPFHKHLMYNITYIFLIFIIKYRQLLIPNLVLHHLIFSLHKSRANVLTVFKKQCIFRKFSEF